MTEKEEYCTHNGILIILHIIKKLGLLVCFIEILYLCKCQIRKELQYLL